MGEKRAKRVTDMNVGRYAVVSCFLSLNSGCKICSCSALPAGTCARIEIGGKEGDLSRSAHHWEHVLVRLNDALQQYGLVPIIL
jgi:hypothetical protein